MEKACQAVLPLPICQHFVYAARLLVLGGGGPSISSWKQVTGRKVCWCSALLLPFIKEAIKVFLSLHNLFQQMLGAVGEKRSLGSVWSPRSAPRGSPIVHFSPVSVCSSAAAPSQPITGGRALSSISGTNPLPQPVLKLMLRMESGSTMPSPE